MLTERLEEEVQLLERHLDVLRTVRERGPIGIRRLAEETGYTQSKARYSLRVLEKEGYVEPSQRGATAKDPDFDRILGGIREAKEELERQLDAHR